MTQHVYWGDAHCNLHPKHLPHIDATFDEAARILDFLPIAYYPFVHDECGGLLIESWGPRDRFDADWQRVCAAVKDHNAPGRFVTFPGYEWHGNRTRWGDVNVFYNADDGPLLATEDLPDLIDQLRPLGAIAIPHHTGYRVTDRGKDWAVHDPQVCPVAEIFSNHGSSEAVDAPYPLLANGDMGPRVSGGTIQDGLARGRRFGLIGSNDGHAGFAGKWGGGLIAVCADELTRDALWHAILERRVYAVTGDRIRLQFRADGHEMGSEFTSDTPIELDISLVASGSIDRIEILRNNRVIHTHCHRGTWRPPQSGRVRAKWRVAAQGGPSEHTGFNSLEPHPMDLAVSVPGGRVLSVEPCFTAPGQRLAEPVGSRAQWHLAIPPRQTNSTPNAQAVIVEFEADVAASISLEIDGSEHTLAVADVLDRCHVIPLMQPSRQRIWATFGRSADDIHNPDPYYHNAHKVLLSRADPEAAYRVDVQVVDQSPEHGANCYYVRVTQDNGQMAWSSPIWVDYRA